MISIGGGAEGLVLRNELGIGGGELSIGSSECVVGGHEIRHHSELGCVGSGEGGRASWPSGGMMGMPPHGVGSVMGMVAWCCGMPC